MEKLLVSVQQAINELRIDDIRGIVQQCLDENIAPIDIIEQGISKGLELVGQKFEDGTYFLADLVMAGEVVKEAMPLIDAQLDPSQVNKKGKVILATVQGDIHEIGKNIVGMLLSANGFEVVDLGVDVSPEKIMAALQETGARFVGLSALLTTMVASIKDVVDSIKEAGLKDNVKVVIGGACTSERLKEDMGADAYGETAVQAVTIFNKFLAHT
jgi:methylmalonyl-CoA mutase cobalamin-binding domain/chain